jgi:hypothetical protein
MKFYSSKKKRKNEILSFAGKWMELEIISSEISQVLKAKHCMFSLRYRI